MALDSDKQTETKCPVFPSFDPLQHPEQLADPGLALGGAREAEPVFFMPQYGLWVMTRYDDVRQAFRDWETFSNASTIRVPDVPPEYADRLEYFPVKFAQPAALDGAEHTRIRRLAQQGLTQTVVRAKTPDMRRFANEAIDGFASQGKVDLVTEYAELIPLQIAAVLMGATASDAPKLRQWMRDSIDLMVEPLEGERMFDVCERSIEFRDFMLALIAERRENPGDDFLSLIVQAKTDSGEPALNDAELIGLASVILTGGTDTTGGLIGRMFHVLLSDRSLWEEVVHDRSLVPAVVEETLRTYTIVHSLVRTTTREVEVAGVRIPKGAPVMLHLDSTNHDAGRFSNPDQFDLHRSKGELADHLAFGKGAHFCIGAPFARPEARIALETMLDRIPGLRMADPDAPPQIFPSLFVGGLTHLEVEWDPSEVRPASAAAVA
jgi:cytochrome P450